MLMLEMLDHTDYNYHLRYEIEAQHSSIKVTVISWLTDDRSRLKDTLCSHFPSSKIVNLWRFNFQLEPITISREVFLAITEPGVTVPATGSHWQPLLPSLNKERLRQMSAESLLQ